MLNNKKVIAKSKQTNKMGHGVYFDINYNYYILNKHLKFR